MLFKRYIIPFRYYLGQDTLEHELLSQCVTQRNASLTECLFVGFYKDRFYRISIRISPIIHFRGYRIHYHLVTHPR